MSLSSSSKSSLPSLSLVSLPLRSRDPNRRASSRARQPAGSAPQDVIVLSSDEDDAPTPLHAPTARTSQKRKRGPADGCQVKPSFPSEASFLTDLRAESDVARLLKEVDQLKRENGRLRQCLEKAEGDKASTAAKCSDLEKTLNRKVLSDTPELAGLDDTISCEICTMKMWHPATLVKCGHTFCETCLRDWFNTTYEQHIQRCPQFLTDPEPRIPPQLYYRMGDLQASCYIAHMRAEHYRRVPRPTYTCPTCRSEVRHRPVEVYAVKDFVRKAARILHDGEEKPQSSNRAAVGSIFDGFFPHN